MTDVIYKKILVIKGVLAEKCELHPALYDELSDLLDDIRILNDAKTSALKNGVDWKTLREKYFNECVEKINSKLKVNMAPHDLFEWFKNQVNL